jgi:hypothetical protein
MNILFPAKMGTLITCMVTISLIKIKSREELV